MSSTAVTFTSSVKKAMRIKDEKALNVMRDDIIDNHRIWVDVGIGTEPNGAQFKVLIRNKSGRPEYLEDYQVMAVSET